jgi:DNA-binding NarL/FixJ family response regulator
VDGAGPAAARALHRARLLVVPALAVAGLARATARFEREFAAGQALTHDQAVAYALSFGILGGRADATLTPRETEVLRLLAEGRSNREVAHELVYLIRLREQ